MLRGFKKVNKIAQLGEDIRQTVDADNRQRIPTASKLYKRLTNWKVAGLDNLETIKKPVPKWIWWVLGIILIILWFFK